MAGAQLEKQLISCTQPSDVCTQLQDLYHRQQLCDVTLTSHGASTSGGEKDLISVECHKVVLSAASGYFRRLFCENRSAELNRSMSNNSASAADNSPPSDVNIVDVSPLSEEAIKCLLSFMYTGRSAIADDGMIQILMDIGYKWELDSLLKSCAEYMANSVDVDNVALFYEIAKKLRKEDLLQQMYEYIREHFSAMQERNTLRVLTSESLLSILKNSEINIDTEDTVFQAVVDWFTAHPELNPSDAAALFDLIRFDELSADCLCDVALDHPLMQDQPQAGYIRNALKNLCKPQPSFLSRYWQGQGKMYFAGKDKTMRFTLKEKIFTFSSNTAIAAKLPMWIDQYSALFSTRENVYILGGFGTKQNSTYIATIQGTAREVNFPEKIRSTTLTWFDNSLLAVAGRGDRYNRNTIRFLHSSECQDSYEWKNLIEMRYSLCNVIALEYHNALYIIGGTDSHECKKQYPYVQRYDRKNRTVQTLSHLPSLCHNGNSGAVVYDNSMMIFTVTQRMQYDETHDMWHVTQYEKIGDQIKPVVYCNAILACVSVGGTCYLKSYDIFSNSWQDTHVDISQCWLPKFFGVHMI